MSIEFFGNTLLKDTLSRVSILTTIGGDVTSHKSSCFLITNSGVFINLAIILINICVKWCKILLGASLILFDLVCSLNTGAFNSFNHSLEFFVWSFFSVCLSLILMLFLCQTTPSILFLFLSLFLFFRVCIPLFSVSFSLPLSVSDPLLCLRLGDQQEPLSVKSPLLIVARLPSSSRDGFSLFLSFSLPDHPSFSLPLCSSTLVLSIPLLVLFCLDLHCL